MLEYISKNINKIINMFYKKDGYYFLKSGMFLDHYLKKTINIIFKEIIYYSGLIFTDFFILKKFINNFFENLVNLNKNLIKHIKKNNLFLVKLSVFFLFIVIIFFIFI